MRRCLLLLVLTGNVITTAAPPVRAEPVTATVAAAALGGWLFGEFMNAATEEVTGRTPSEWLLKKPRLEDMRRDLDALAAKDAKNQALIKEIKGALRERMTRTEVQAVLMKALRKVDSDLARIADRVTMVEGEAKQLRAENTRLKNRIAELDLRTSARTAKVESRVSVVEWKVNEHEQRLKRLEDAVATLAVRGFGHYFGKRYASAIDEFDNALEKDPGNPAYYYGKALAYRAKRQTKDAEKAVRMGANAERMRRPPAWYATVMERIQGPDRQWFSVQRARALRDAGSK